MSKIHHIPPASKTAAPAGGGALARAPVVPLPRRPVRLPPPAIQVRVLAELRAYVEQLVAEEQRGGTFSRELSCAVDWLTLLEDQGQ